ncbi:aromatic acid exporter family protein [Streptomyces sp. NPDC048603]|uniref:FUSC family protein n=1 Tax=Streptomyces sp. NPDC048603 TaxID=3365577 RepID=UPI00371D4243
MGEHRSDGGAGGVRGRARRALVAEGPVAARIAVTVVAAWQTALWLGADQPPVFAAIVPLVAVRSDPSAVFTTSLERVAGVVAGVLLAIALLQVLRPSTAALALVVVLGLALGMVLNSGNGINVQIAVSSLLVLANPSPDAYALDRMWETAVGAAVTVLLAPLLWPPDPRRALASSVEECRLRLGRALAGSIRVLGTDPASARDNLGLVRRETEAVRRPANEARNARRVLRFDPLRRRQRAEVSGLVRRLFLAHDLCGGMETLAEEVAAFTGRADLAADVDRARRDLAALASATARAVDDALAGHDPGPAVAEARSCFAAYSAAESRPVAVALRRPFLRLLDTVDAAGRPG